MITEIIQKIDGYEMIKSHGKTLSKKSALAVLDCILDDNKDYKLLFEEL